MELADDSDRSVRFRAWDAVKELRIRKALPVLEARLVKDTGDFGGSTRHILEETISLLKENPTPATGESGPTAEQAKTIADLERQAADLELKSKELRSQDRRSQTQGRAQCTGRQRRIQHRIGD